MSHLPTATVVKAMPSVNQSAVQVTATKVIDGVHTPTAVTSVPSSKRKQPEPSEVVKITDAKTTAKRKRRRSTNPQPMKRLGWDAHFEHLKKYIQE